ncbi:hypothetical protein DS421_3g66500 [Arachis hypogaea]|nr:hypothetical protein DS421_3g66500 [Arachis hypogaea]
MLREANPHQLQKIVLENILAFNPTFWIRLAARSDTCKSEDDKEKIESATDVLKGVLKPVVDNEGEISWPPRDPQGLTLMEMEISQREQEGQLDEGFLAEVNAQLRQAKEDGDKPGLEAMLQKVLQLYASTVLSRRSYAMKGSEVLKDEQFLENIIQAPEEEWNNILIKGLTIGAGDISPEELDAVVKKRIERTLIRTVRQPCFKISLFSPVFIFFLTDVTPFPYRCSLSSSSSSLRTSGKQRREVLTNSGF